MCWALTKYLTHIPSQMLTRALQRTIAIHCSWRERLECPWNPDHPKGEKRLSGNIASARFCWLCSCHKGPVHVHEEKGTKAVTPGPIKCYGNISSEREASKIHTWPLETYDLPTSGKQGTVSWNRPGYPQAEVSPPYSETPKFSVYSYLEAVLGTAIWTPGQMHSLESQQAGGAVRQGVIGSPPGCPLPGLS